MLRAVCLSIVLPAASRPTAGVAHRFRADHDERGLQRIIAGAQGRAIEIAAAEKLLAGLTPYRGLCPSGSRTRACSSVETGSPRRLFRREGDNAVTLNTPHKLNALSLAVIEALIAEFDAIADDPARASGGRGVSAQRRLRPQGNAGAP
jgi:hypothetical protein